MACSSRGLAFEQPEDSRGLGGWEGTGGPGGMGEGSPGEAWGGMARTSHLKRLLTLTINIMHLEELSGSRWTSGRPWEAQKKLNRNASNPCNEAIDLALIFYQHDQKYCSHWPKFNQASYTKHTTIDRIHSIRGPNGVMK